MNSIGEKIKKLRKNNSFTREELAGKLKIKPEKLRFWEKDLNRPPNNVLSSIAEIFDIDIDYFFDENYVLEEKKKSLTDKSEIVSAKKETEKSAADKKFYEEIRNDISDLKKKMDEITDLLRHHPRFDEIVEIDTVYSVDTVNEKLKKGWILLELFKNERGILGYKLGKKG